MLIYNITFSISDEVHDDCLLFLRNTYVPQALEGTILSKAQLCKVLGSSQDGHSSYSLQFHVHNLDQLTAWWKQRGEGINALLVKQFSDKVVGFTTILEKIAHQ